MGADSNAVENISGFWRFCSFHRYWRQRPKSLYRPLVIAVIVVICFLVLAFSLPTNMNAGTFSLGMAAVYTPLAVLPFLLLPLGTVTIDYREDRKNQKFGVSSSTVKEEKTLEIIVDGVTTVCKNAKLPRQIKIYFWRKGRYTVLVVVNNNMVFTGELNFYDDNSAAITIPVSVPMDTGG